jgi:hypothetical protein
VFDDNGPGSTPGDTLALDTLDYNGGQGWYGAEVEPEVEITDGSGFYIACMGLDDQNPYVGFDLTPPFSHQMWEYSNTFGWRPGRDRFTEDVGVRCDIEPWFLPDVVATVDEFQRTTVRGAPGITPPNASLDFAVNFRNTTPGNVSTQWWIDAYLGPNLVYRLGPYSLFLLGGQELDRIYGLPVPSNAPVAGDYRLCVRVGSYPDAEHEDSFPFEIKSRGLQ